MTDVLPPGVKFVTAASAVGTWSEDNGVVTFHLGLLEDVFLQLTVTVVPTQPGQAVNAVEIRANEGEQSVANNSSSLTTPVQGQALPAQVTGVGSELSAALDQAGDLNLSLQILAPNRIGAGIGQGGMVQLSLPTVPGRTYRVESSRDLVSWATEAEFRATTVLTAVKDTLGTGPKFYRVRPINSGNAR